MSESTKDDYKVYSGHITFGKFPCSKVVRPSEYQRVMHNAGFEEYCEENDTYSVEEIKNKGFETSEGFDYLGDRIYQKDVEVKFSPANNVKYRLVYFPCYRYKVTNNLRNVPSINGELQELNGYPKGHVYIFQYKDLVWRIHKEDENGYLLSTENVIDSQVFAIGNKKNKEDAEKETNQTLEKYFAILANKIFTNDQLKYLGNYQGRENLFLLTLEEFRGEELFNGISYFGNENGLSNVSRYLNATSGRYKECTDYALCKGFFTDGHNRTGGYCLSNFNYDRFNNFGYSYFKGHMNKLIMCGNRRGQTTGVAPCIYLLKEPKDNKESEEKD